MRPAKRISPSSEEVSTGRGCGFIIINADVEKINLDDRNDRLREGERGSAL